MEVPKNGICLMENPVEMDDLGDIWGYPLKCLGNLHLGLFLPIFNVPQITHWFGRGSIHCSQTLESHIGVAALGTCELLFGDSTPARLMSNFFYNPRRSCSCGWWQDSVRVVFRSFDEESEVAMMT